MLRFIQLKFRNFQLAFHYAIKHGLPDPDNQLYIGSGRNRDFFQHRETHEIFNVYLKGKTGLNASPQISL